MGASQLKAWATTLLRAAVWVSPLAFVSCVKDAGPTTKAEEIASVSSALCQVGQECCPAGYTQVTLTQNSDSYSTITPKLCIVALGGSDVMSINGSNDIVLAGDGDDNVFAGPSSTVRGGKGRDTINIYGGPATCYGGPDDDTINAANGNNFVAPGPGRDTVAMGTGDDTVALYDLCEIVGGGKNLDGGSGFNTLITPVPVDQLVALGNTVTNFQNIIVQPGSCKSECATQPVCGPNGFCAEGPTPGQTVCECIPPFAGPQCNDVCVSPTDSDHDGVKDCNDRCPHDPNKTLPGTCGCNVSDLDTDGDNVADCLDECPRDPNNTIRGQCGCVGEPGLQPAGAHCTDLACPGGGPGTCNGAGVCGNRSLCPPASGCRFINWHESSYWFCGVRPPRSTLPDGGVVGGPSDAGTTPGQTTWNGAQTNCGNKGLTLTRVDSLEEDKYLASLVTDAIWLGANDLQTVNTWRWSAPGNNNGDQFWQGGATGAPVAGRFAYWLTGRPGTTLRCATIRPGDGRWSDTNCAETHGYVCEYRLPIVKVDGSAPPLPGPFRPPPRRDGGCTPIEDSGLPDTLDALAAQVAATEFDVFQGAAANPPPVGSTCLDDPDANAIGFGPSDSGAGCVFTNIDKVNECTTDKNCSAGFICRHVADDPNCKPNGDAGVPKDGSTCLGHARCGQLVCPAIPFPNRCGQVELCNQGVTDFDAGLDPGSNLDAGAFNPASLFTGPMPDARPTTAYSDPPDGQGAAHTWCSMGPQDPNAVKKADEAPKDYSGQSGQSSPISFKFDPDLVFEVDPRPLALGETNLHMRAAAKLKTTVTLKDFLKQNFSTTILDASIGIVVDRCSVNDVDETYFKLFGLDFITGKDLGIPQINTNNPSIDQNLFDLSKNCNDSLATFQTAADRAKKAYRDAQQLLIAYQTARAAGQILSGDLCKQIGVVAASVPWFPGGNACPIDEPVERTINRFIDFYQSAGFGQVDRLREASNALSSATGHLREGGNGQPLLRPTIDIANFSRTESATIANAIFVIGPVPMVLQVDVFATYGIAGRLDALVAIPLDLDMIVGDTPSDPSAIAKVGAKVVPYASAGLSAFVGAGFDLGPIAATIGIEGALTLAKVSAPIYAGASLNMQVLKDTRQLLGEALPPITTAAAAFQFRQPKSFKFFVAYDYGIGIDLTDVLSGEINARLRIKFFFFSRTWRSRVVKFNGFSTHIDIIKGGSDPSVHSPDRTISPARDPDNSVESTTKVAGGQATMGLREAQLPLMELARLPLPPPGSTPDGSVMPFDASAVQKFFYDDLCCSKSSCNPLAPFTRPQCCPGYTCINPVVPDGSIAIPFCQKNCGTPNEDCSQTTDCCPGLICNSLHTCAVCSEVNQDCRSDEDCCPGGGGLPFLSCGPSQKCEIAN